MKSKYTDEIISKIIIIAIIVILVGAMIYWVMGVYKDKKSAADSANSKINNANHEMADFDLLVYDGKSINGDTLKDLIENLYDNRVAVSVQVLTLANQTPTPTSGTSYNCTISSTATTFTEPAFPSNKGDNNYITPSATFVGTIVKNDNDEIVCLKFTQQN